MISSWAALVTAKETRFNSTLPVLATGLALPPELEVELLAPPPQAAIATLKLNPTKNSDTNLFILEMRLIVSLFRCHQPMNTLLLNSQFVGRDTVINSYENRFYRVMEKIANIKKAIGFNQVNSNILDKNIDSFALVYRECN